MRPISAARIHLALWTILLNAPPAAPAEPGDVPRVNDQRLRLHLFAEHPQVVTPTGLAVDDQGAVLVIESHTHFRPDKYQGPATDRILRMQDSDGDGRADSAEVFFEGTTHTMNVAAGAKGWVYVATRNEVFRLRDADQDGRAELRETLVRLQTPGNYPHNGLSGFAIGISGEIVFGMGENLGEDYELIGADGRTLRGGGEGGAVYRCDAEGRQLRRLATGFWNPFHVAFDAYGRLFAVDNDPDWRPPCRLLHVVEGADFGYRFRNGRRGLHPFTAWFGDLPGTLGMVAGTGEAPSGVIAYESYQLPAEYEGDLIVTSWGYHAIERYRLLPRGATVQSAAETIVKGGENFRPVGIALAPDGSLYISDWVSRSYELHRRGRIWRLAAADPAPLREGDSLPQRLRSAHRPRREQAARQLLDQGPAGREELRRAARSAQRPAVRALAVEALAAAGELRWKDVEGEQDPRVRALAARHAKDWQTIPFEEEPAAVQAAVLRRLDRLSERDLKRTWRAAESDDPYLRCAARTALRSSLDQRLADWSQHGLPESPARRLQAVLLLRERDDRAARAFLPTLLRDADDRVRRAAVQWVGESGLTEFRDQLQSALADGRAGGGLLTAYLASLSLLDGERAADFEKRMDQAVAEVMLQPDASAAALAYALRNMSPAHELLTIDRLRQWTEHSSGAVRLEAVRSLRQSPHVEKFDVLSELARRKDWPAELRAEAAAGLDPQNAAARSALLRQVADASPPVASAALRALDGAHLVEAERRQLAALADGRQWDDLIDRASDPNWKAPGRPRESDLDAWVALATAERGDPRAGRLVFLSRTASCSKCHRVDGRGGEIGPDLSSASRMPLERLVESIVQPSRDIAPQYTPWAVRREDGTTFQGVLLGERATDQQYGTSEGKLVTVKHEQLAQRRPLTTSIMPAALLDRLTDQEFRDLLAFLRLSD